MTTDTGLGVGDSDLPWLDVAPADSGTTATLTVIDPSNTPTTVTVAGGPLEPIPGSDPVEYTQRWTATTPVTYTTAGRWVRRWKTTNTGEGEHDDVVYVVDRVPGATVTLDPATPVGMIRLLITDVSPTEPLFSDAQLTALLTAESQNVKLAAASALLVIARSETLLSKKITTQDLSTDGPAVAKELRESAAQLRAEAAAEAAAADTSGLDIVPYWSFPPADPRFDSPLYF